MPKISTFALQRGVSDPMREFCWQDPENNPGVEIKVTLRRLGVVDAINLPVQQDAIVTAYIKGVKIITEDPVSGNKTVKFDRPETIPPLNDHPVTISVNTARLIAILMVAQHTVDVDDAYQAWEWAHILTVPAFAKAALRTVMQYVMAEMPDTDWLTEEEDPNDPLAGTGDTGQVS